MLTLWFLPHRACEWSGGKIISAPNSRCTHLCRSKVPPYCSVLNQDESHPLHTRPRKHILVLGVVDACVYLFVYVLGVSLPGVNMWPCTQLLDNSVLQPDRTDVMRAHAHTYTNICKHINSANWQMKIDCSRDPQKLADEAFRGCLVPYYLLQGMTATCST